MADLFKAYETDPTLEREGVWIDVDPSEEKDPAKRAKFRIVYDDHPEVKRAIAEHHREYAQFYMRTGKAIPHDIEVLGIARMAAAEVRDWQNIDDEQGQPLAPTVENKVEFFRRIRFLREQVVLLAGRTETFRKAIVAEVGKGSPTT